MNEWAQATYGDPCRDCGYQWSIEPDQAIELVGAVPQRYATLLSGLDGSQRHPDLAWSAKAYVSHVVDNLRIWAERLAGAATGARGPVAPYHADLLAQAREYEALPLAGALWSLDRSVRAWHEAVRLADEAAVVLSHPERGDQAVAEVVLTNAHDAHHHAWDIERCLAGAARGS